MAVKRRSNTGNIDLSKFNRNGNELNTNSSELKHKVEPTAKAKTADRVVSVDSVKKTSLTRIMSMREAMEEGKKAEKNKKLFGQLWWKSELSVVFATTGVGKTVLSMQIAEAVATGTNVFDAKDGQTEFINECDPQVVVVVDWELSLKQILTRYQNDTDESDCYEFSKNLLRVDRNSGFKFKIGDKVSDMLTKEIRSHVEEMNAEALIIDNLSVLRNGTENSKEALPLMEYLYNLKTELGLSILVVAHTPKKDTISPINEYHLQGSAQIGNALDGLFAIGLGPKVNDRYIKELKQRNGMKIAEKQVIFCELRKDKNFLKFHYIDRGLEQEMLTQVTEDDVLQIEARVIELNFKGQSHVKISNEVGWSSTKVGEWLAKFRQYPDVYPLAKAKLEELKKKNKNSTETTQTTDLAQINSAVGLNDHEIPF